MDNVKTGKYIKLKMDELGLKQEKLAEKLDVSSRAISSWVNGKATIKQENIEKLAIALGVSVMEIMDGRDHDDLAPETKREIDELLKELNKELYSVQNITIDIEEGSLLSTDIAICALSFSFFAMGMVIWGTFEHTTWNNVSVALFVILGVAMLLLGRTFVRTMNHRIKERKRKIQIFQEEKTNRLSQ